MTHFGIPVSMFPLMWEGLSFAYEHLLRVEICVYMCVRIVQEQAEVIERPPFLNIAFRFLPYTVHALISHHSYNRKEKKTGTGTK